MDWSIVRKLWGVLAVLTIAGIGFIFVGEPLMESRQAEKIDTFLASLPGSFKAGRITTNLLEDSFIINNLSGVVKNADGSESEISVMEIAGSGINEDALAGGKASLLEKVELDHVSVRTIASINGVAVPREITADRLFLRDIEGDPAALPGKNLDAGALLAFMGGLSAQDFNATACADTVTTTQGKVVVDAHALDFRAANAGAGTLADIARLMLPGILNAQAGSGADQQTIRQGLEDFSRSGGVLTVSLQPEGTLSMLQLEEPGAVSLNAAVKVTPEPTAQLR